MNLTLIFLFLFGLILLERLYRVIAVQQKRKQIVREQIQDIITNPQYKVRGKYE